MDKSNLLKGFNTHLDEFFNDILHVFPNDIDIQKAHISLIGLKKINPKLIINVWKTYILDLYEEEINNGSIDYFLNKNYTKDLENTDSNKEILSKIEDMKASIKLMTDENKNKTIKYIQNLTKLCKLYFQ